MSPKLEMTLDEMELFLQKSITSVRSRPKRLRKDSKMIRFDQRQKVQKFEAEIKSHKFSSTIKFLTAILSIRCSDEGTPV